MWRFVAGVEKPPPNPYECPGCKKDCSNAGALSVHKNFCDDYKAWTKKQQHIPNDTQLSKS